MGWIFTHELDLFEAEAGPFLARRPVQNSVPRPVCGTLRRRGLDVYGGAPPEFGWWRPDGGGEVAAAFVRTPPYPPLLTPGTPRSARELAVELAARTAGRLPGVRGDSEAAHAFAESWRDRTGAVPHTDRELRMYRLGTLVPRPVPPGRARVAGLADRDLLLRWQERFAEDVGEPTPSGARSVDDALAYGGRTLWEVDGEPVAMAGSTAPEDGAIRIVGVYTPDELRGRGYAGAVTAAVSRAALESGARDVMLGADRANPISTGLYQRLGYVPVCDHASISFAGPLS
jgi:predicted GNAT family acetyltransferase